MKDLRILADDLTGALDSAAAFAGDVPVYLDEPQPSELKGAVAVVATATRDVPFETLPQRLGPAIQWLASGGIAFKKVDSLLRGNSFAETALAARVGRFRRIVFAPAFPQQGRVTVDGRQCVIPSGKTLAERQSIGAGSPADAFTVLGLPIEQTLRARRGGLAVWIPEVHDDHDLVAIAELSLRPGAGEFLWCGSAGLAHALAAAHGLAPRTANVDLPAMPQGPVLMISASRHPVVRSQWNILKSAARGAIMALHSQPAALRSAFTAMAGGFDFAMFDLAPARPMLPEDAAALLARHLDTIAAQTPRPAALVIVGGDTLRGVCRAAGATALVARASPRTGWGCARLVGGQWDGVLCFSRSGAFGDPDDLSTMVRLVTERTATKRTSR
jgi:uncharacterized protein YgbK (DUF1537 family)